VYRNDRFAPATATACFSRCSLERGEALRERERALAAAAEYEKGMVSEHGATSVLAEVQYI